MFGYDLCVLHGNPNKTQLPTKVQLSKRHKTDSVERNTKLSNSKTLFIVIGASIFWGVPSLVFYCFFFFSSGLPWFVNYIFSMLRTNSLVNPIIYSLRMSVFRETLKRFKKKLKIRKQLNVRPV